MLSQLKFVAISRTSAMINHQCSMSDGYDAAKEFYCNNDYRKH